MNEWMNHKGVSRTVPATPGLLNWSNRLLFDIVFVKHQICKVSLYWNKSSWLFKSKKFVNFHFFMFGNRAFDCLYFTDLWGVRVFSNYYLCSICAKWFFLLSLASSTLSDMGETRKWVSALIGENGQNRWEYQYLAELGKHVLKLLPRKIFIY